MNAQAAALKQIAGNHDPLVLSLWAMPRPDVEKIYAQAFQKNDIEAVRWLGRNDRYFLLSSLLRRPDVRDDWVFARIREVEADPDDHIDLWSREHYKSTIITFAGVIQEIIKDPEITVCIFSHDRPAAKAFLNQIRTELEENALLKSVYPEIFWDNPRKQSRRWSEDGGIIVQRKGNPKESTVEAWGVVDGLPAGKHFGILLYDDLVTESNVTNPDMIKKTTVQWELSGHIGKRFGRRQMVGTRYHFADTYGVILKRGLFTERRYAATHNGKFDGTPVFLTEKEWEDHKRDKGRETIASQMLLNPIEGSERAFDLRTLQFWTVRPKRLNVYIMCDPSKGRHATSDNTAIVVIGVDVNRNRYLMDGWCHRMNLSRRWHMIRDTYRRWSRMQGVEAVHVGYEQFGMQTDDEYFLERMLIEKISFPITELKWPRSGPKSKRQRIERLEPEIRMGRFRLPNVIDIDDEGNIFPLAIMDTSEAKEMIAQNEKWRVAQTIHKKDQDGKLYDFLSKFIEEFIFFPAAPYEDILDATSRIYDMEPAPPVHYDTEAGREMSLDPEVYVDGV